MTRVRPISLTLASRISGITPADVALPLAHLGGKRSSRRVRGNFDFMPLKSTQSSQAQTFAFRQVRSQVYCCEELTSRRSILTEFAGSL